MLLDVEGLAMKRASKLFALFFLGSVVGLPTGSYLVEHKFIEKEKAMGLHGEEAIADDFAKTQFTHADPQSAREALLYAVNVHKEMQFSNSKYWGWPEKMDLGWCYAELSVLEESAGNTNLSKNYMALSDQIFKEGDAKDSTLAHLRQVLRETQSKPISNPPANGKP